MLPAVQAAQSSEGCRGSVASACPARIANESRSESVTGVTAIGSPGYSSFAAATAAACTGSVSNSDSSSPTWHCGVMENDTRSIVADGRVAIELREPEIRAAGDRGHDPAARRRRAYRSHERRRGYLACRVEDEHAGDRGELARGVEDAGHAAGRRLGDGEGELQLGTCRRCQRSRAAAIRRHRVASRGRCRCDGGAARGSRSRSRRRATQAAPCRPLRSPGPRHRAPAGARSSSARPRAVALAPRPTGEPVARRSDT